MSSTYTPQRAINLVQRFVHGVPLADVQADICDEINSLIWTAYPWPWSIAALTPISLTDGTQDYTINSGDGTNLLRLLRVRIVRTDTTPNEFRELMLTDNLSPELTWKLGIETNRLVGFFNSTNTLRLGAAASVGTNQTLQLQGEYQQLPTRITDAQMNTAFPFPDWMYNVFVDGLKWKIYQLSDDPRAGSFRFVKNGSMQKTYDGQGGLFWESLSQAARTVDLSRGDDQTFPDNPLGVGHQNFLGIYGV